MQPTLKNSVEHVGGTCRSQGMAALARMAFSAASTEPETSLASVRYAAFQPRHTLASPNGSTVPLFHRWKYLAAHVYSQCFPQAPGAPLRAH